MYHDQPTRGIDQPSHNLLLDHLQTLTHMQQRAETLLGQMAVLKRQLAREFPCPSPSEHRVVNAVAKGSILVDLNHPAVNAIAREMLLEFGHRVETIDRREREVPAHHSFDAILLDVMQGDAAEIGEVRLARQRVPHVVIATSLPFGHGRQRLWDAGAAGIVGLPLVPSELKDCFNQVLCGVYGR